MTILSQRFFNKQTRFDFFIEKKKQKSFIEVKNVTLFRDKKTAEFQMQLLLEDQNIYSPLLMP